MRGRRTLNYNREWKKSAAIVSINDDELQEGFDL